MNPTTVLLALAMSLFAAKLPSLAADESSISDEVKIPLKSSLVGKDGSLNENVLQKLGVEDKKKAKARQMQVLDTVDQKLFRRGWIVRERTKEKKLEIERSTTFKRRYTVQGEAWREALAEAKKDFGNDLGKHEVQREWGTRGLTLSVALDTALPGFGGDLPGCKDAPRPVAASAPAHIKKMLNADLSQLQVYGPVKGRRWKGQVPGVEDELDVEVWTVRKAADSVDVDYLAEVSFKAKDAERAAVERTHLLKALNKDWVELDGTSRTEQIFHRYKPCDPSLDSK